MLRALLITTALASSTAILSADVPGPRPPAPAVRGPGIRIWTSSGDLYHRNERVRVYYRTERDAFVTILRVDTDGRVRILFPRSPMDDGYVSAGATYTVSNYDRGTAFVVDDYPGVGYIFAIASYEPFEYRAIHDGNRWDLRQISDGRIHGDPRSSLEELMVGLLPRDYEDFDTHIQQYYVERRFDYPRFVCYDCHAYTPYLSWNPYHSWCRSYTLVVWNDPWYYYPSYWYPTRYYGGRRVVYSYPRTASRYVFKERDDRSPGVDYRRRDQSAPATTGGGRRIDERGVRAVDIGGVGRVPAPRITGDRRIASDRPEPREEPRDPREGTNVDGGRRTSGGGADVSRPESRGSEGRGDQQPRRVEIVQPERGRPDARPDSRPESRIESRPESREPSARPESRPESREPAARPESRPESRQPSARPESRQPSARPESREPAARPDTREPAARPDRSQPERSQPQARPAAPETRSRPEASRPSSPPPSSRPAPRAQPAPREGSSGRDGGLTRRRP